jgi:hypothetical protein
VQTDGFWSKIKGFFKPKESVKVERKKFNWAGVLLQGALMRGEAMHDISSVCMVKFMICKSAEMLKDEFRNYLHESLQPEIVIDTFD